MNPTDHIQIVTFQLEGLSPDASCAHAEAAAPAFTEIPGLRAKAWLANPPTNTYGGVYAWESREAMKAYVAGPIFGALLANPAMAHVDLTAAAGALQGSRTCPIAAFTGQPGQSQTPKRQSLPNHCPISARAWHKKNPAFAGLS